MSDAANPYAPPGSEVGGVEADRPPVIAGKGRRFGTLIIDYVAFLTLSMCIGISVALLFGEAGLEAMEQVPDWLFGIGLISAYYLFFEGLWGRTPGKWLFGTKVINESGGQASFGQILGRTLCRFIPFEAFSFFGERGWHDSIPKTQVVLTRIG